MVTFIFSSVLPGLVVDDADECDDRVVKEEAVTEEEVRDNTLGVASVEFLWRGYVKNNAENWWKYVFLSSVILSQPWLSASRGTTLS